MLEFQVPLSVLVEFLQKKFRTDRALINVVFEGSDLIFVFGERLPESGEINRVTLEFPFEINPQELRPFVKEEVD